MKSYKLKVFVLIITVLLCIPSFLYAMVEEKIEEDYPLKGDGKVYLENVSGNITVKSWGKDEVKILARKVAKDKEALDNVSVDVKKTDGNIRIITRFEKSHNWYRDNYASVHYDLIIPDKAQLRVKSVSGSIEASNIGGSADLETVSGGVDLAGAAGGAKCKSISGSISLEDIVGDTATASTSGRISISDIKGSVDVKNVSGGININNVSMAEEIKAETVSGSIGMQGELSPGGIYEFKTVSGGIRLDLPSNSDFELDASSFSGGVQCDFKLETTGEIKRNKMQGIAGKGGATLKASSFSGSVSIK